MNRIRALAARRDFVSGSVLFAASVFALWEALGLNFGTIRAPGSGFFPICLSVFLLIASAAIILKSLRATTSDLSPSHLGSPPVWIAAVSFILYAVLLEQVGYVICTSLMLLLWTRGFGRMSWARSLVLTLASVGISYSGFVKLGVPLPHGILPF